ncbi:toprim domain-containing protein [Lactococcus garvieae]|uniref:DUF3991 domain-containing protein n=1 Tax=Lactococcus garvieae TaxID=1363 RepID=A0A1I4GJ10_9LACT|nr:toprim domain-containing protein [Lactococcus garvieae]SFL29161.1 Protein of unknown function [Lactococcus garvieae]
MAYVNKKKEAAKNKSILDVAQALGMNLERSGKDYIWKDHDSFTLSPSKNIWTWWSHGDEYRGQDVIKLVQVVKEISYKEAVNFILGSEAASFDVTKIPKKQPFVYRLPEAKNMDYAKKFLKEIRGLSEETIDFFASKGVIAQGIYQRPDKSTEPVVVFKNFDLTGKIVGASIQGIWRNEQLYPKKGRIKKILPNSDGYSGMFVDIGDKMRFREATKEAPFTLYAFETPLDMMAYYELNKSNLDNCRLVSMDGLKKGVVSREVVDAVAHLPKDIEQVEKTTRKENYLDKTDQPGFNTGLKIVLCVDNDEAGRNFIRNFGLAHIKVVPHVPPLPLGQSKNDWNDELKLRKASKSRSLDQEIAIAKTKRGQLESRNTVLQVTKERPAEFEMGK